VASAYKPQAAGPVVQEVGMQAGQLMNAARMIGDTGLFALMEAASGMIRRDIVSAASLYVA
jgi:superfamily II RNA helicase